MQQTAIVRGILPAGKGKKRKRLTLSASSRRQLSLPSSGILARLARFERAAFRLGGERSILLSYRRKHGVL